MAGDRDDQVIHDLVELVTYLVVQQHSLLNRLDRTVTAISDAIAALQTQDATSAANLSKFEADVSAALADLAAKAAAGTVTPEDVAAVQALTTASASSDASVTAADTAAVAADPGAQPTP